MRDLVALLFLVLAVLRISPPFSCSSLTESALAAGSEEDRSVSSPSPCVGRTYHRGRTGPGGQSWLAVQLDRVSVGDKEAKKRARFTSMLGNHLHNRQQ